MSIIYILIPIAILLTALGIYLFFWAVKTEQFDDLEKQGMSILFDEDITDKDSAGKVHADNEAAEIAIQQSAQKLSENSDISSDTNNQVSTAAVVNKSQ